MRKSYFTLLVLSSIVFKNSDAQVNVRISPASNAVGLTIYSNSGIDSANLSIKENDFDFARINLSNTQASNVWTIAANTSTTRQDERFNIYNRAIGDVLSIAGSGQVGIGRNPQTPVGSFGSAPQLQIKQSSVFAEALRLEGAGDAGNWSFQIDYTNSNLMVFANSVHKGTFSIVNGSYSTASDRRLKKDIKDINPSLSAIMQLKAKQYHYLDNKPADLVSYGFIAQDVEKVFPAVVNENNVKGAKLLSVDYNALSVNAIKAIQEQQHLIVELQKKVHLLEKEIRKMKK